MTPSNPNFKAAPDPATDPAHTEALRRERRSQLRGLLFLAAAILVFLLLRGARPLHLFAPNWWRL